MTTTENGLALLKGPPLEEEPGLGPLTLGGFLLEVTERYAEREALVFHEGGRTVRWTYRDLKDRAFEVARALIGCGVSKGTRVGVMMTNRPEFLSSVFGAALSGCVATPVSTFSTASELDYLLKLSGVSVLLYESPVLDTDFTGVLRQADPAFSSAAPGGIATEAYPFLRHAVVVGDGAGGAIEDFGAFLKRGDRVAESLVEAANAATTPSDPGVLFFSSGSTSKPKGVLSAHRGVTLQLWRWKRLFAIERVARIWSANGFFWSGNFAMALGGALSSGGALILQKTFEPVEALELMEDEKATMALAWPHQWAKLEAAPNYGGADLSALHYVDERTPLAAHPTVNTTWRQPSAAFGNTETFTINTVFPSGTPEEEIAGSSGRPLPGNTIKIIDPFTAETLSVGERGEIAVKGATLMLGYLGTPLDETLDAEGFLRTGDGGYIDAEGRLYWEGRLNDIIKTGGANVSPLEVDALVSEIAGVKVCQTVGVPHDTLGEIVVTCIVPHDGARLDEASIREAARKELAAYKVPRRVLFFSEDELELTGSAKIKTGDLRSLAARRIGEAFGA